MNEIIISRHPTINEALKSELKADSKAKSMWDKFYGINTPYTADYEDDYGYGCVDDYYDSLYSGTSSDEKKIYFFNEISEDDVNDYDYFPDEVFDNYKQLKTFCDDNGIEIPEYETDLIDRRKVSFCTIDPLDKAEGKLTLFSEYSWSRLLYQYGYLCDYLEEEKKYHEEE